MIQRVTVDEITFNGLMILRVTVDEITSIYLRYRELM